MKWNAKLPDDKSWLLYPAAILIAIIVLLIQGCTSTITPVHTEASAPSFDGGMQDSGFLGWSTNSTTGEVVGMLTPHARDRYNALVSQYGKLFRPPLTIDQGVWHTNTATMSAFAINRQALVNFETLSRWHRENKKP